MQSSAMQLNYRIRIDDKLYQPVMTKERGKDVMELIEVACGRCLHYTDWCPYNETTHADIAEQCERWERK